MVAAVARRTGTPARPRMARVRGVEVFAAGTYRGRTYTVSDLDEMAANARLLGPGGLGLLHPPVVLGHEERQEFLERTDLPAGGWVNPDSVRREGRRLLADFEDVPPEIAEAINRRAYRKVSAEVYDDFEDDSGRTYGKALRRVALLGGDLPQVKGLADIPYAEFAEVLWRPGGGRPELTKILPSASGRGVYWAFSERVSRYDEGTDVDTQAIKDALLAAGMSQEVVSTLTDEQLTEIRDKLLGGAPAGGGGAGESFQEGGPTRDELIAELAALGEDPAALEGKSDEELRALLEAQVGGGAAGPGAFNDPSPPPGGGEEEEEDDDELALMQEGGGVELDREEMIAVLTGQGHDPAELAAKTDEELALLVKEGGAGAAPAGGGSQSMSAMRPKSVTVTHKFAEELRRETSLLRKTRREAQRELAEARRERKAAKVHRFCEAMVKAGKLLPTERKSVSARLMRASDSKVYLFADKKSGRKFQLSELDLQMREIRRRPQLVRFAEKVKSSASRSRPSEAEEVAKVERFSEAAANTATLARLYGSAEAGKRAMVEAFREARKRNPDYTAAEFLRVYGN